MLRSRLAQMWTDRQLKHRIELLAPDALEHEADAQGDVGDNEAPVNQVGDHVDRLHANQRLTDHGEDEYAVADVDVHHADVTA